MTKAPRDPSQWTEEEIRTDTPGYHSAVGNAFWDSLVAAPAEMSAYLDRKARHDRIRSAQILAERS
jgi:hypothetical protein